MIYLDNAATTQMLDECIKTMEEYSRHSFFNASAIYGPGSKVQSSIISCKETIATAIGTMFADNIVFTGSATEANNLAILGCYRKNFGKMIFSCAEHPSVFNVAEKLKLQGVNVEYIKLQPSGEVDYDDLEKKLDSTVSFISIITVCNETGAINNLRKISELKNKYCPTAIFHSDGVQAFGKIKINVEYFGVDLFTISAHKAFGPKGIGALYVKNKKLLNPVIYGGGQEYGLRSGTENTPSIMAFQTAINNFGNIKENYAHVQNCFNEFIAQINTSNIKINSFFSPYILSLSFVGVNGETLVHMMEQKQIYISRGSACSSKKSGNRVLENMGLSPQEILGSVRISFSKFTTINEAREAGKALNECYITLKEKLKWKK